MAEWLKAAVLKNRKARKGLGGSNPSSSATYTLQRIDISEVIGVLSSVITLSATFRGREDKPLPTQAPRAIKNPIQSQIPLSSWKHQSLLHHFKGRDPKMIEEVPRMRQSTL